MTAHSRFGGSVADRVIGCAGSTALIATVPAKTSSSYAAEGTLAHALGEWCLNNDTRTAAIMIDRLFTWFDHGEKKNTVITAEMARAVDVYLDAVFAELDAAPDAELFVEQGFVLEVDGADKGEVFGTNDAMVYTPSRKRLRVFDYKHGVGVSVTADDNSQLKFYGSGALFANPDWRVSDLVLTIVQPRARDADEIGAVRDWPMDVLEVLAFTDDYGVAVTKAKAVKWVQGIHDPTKQFLEPGSLALGPWCKWCDAAAVCPLKEQAVLRQAQLDFKDITEITAAVLPDPKSFDTARLGQILKAGTLLNDWLGQIQSYVEALLLAGTPVEGWKVVEKIGRAKWIEDGEAVAAELSLMHGLDEDLVRPRKLTTITEVEKMLKAEKVGKEAIDDFKLKFTVKDSGGLTIAPASDRRPAVDALQSDFGDVKIETP